MTKVRIAVQLLFWVLFGYLWLAVLYGVKVPLPVHFFFALSPLAMFGQKVSYAWLSIAVILLTLVLGRFFCGWLCPLGTTFDLWRALLPRRFKAHASRLDGKLKYYILTALLLAFVLGGNLIFFFEPISLWFRTLTFTLFSPLVYFTAHYTPVKIFTQDQVSYPTGWLFALIFIILLYFESREKRWYCKKLCPQGALLSILSALSPFAVRRSSACTGCNACLSDCRKDKLEAECTRCFSCFKACPNSALSWRVKTRTPAFNLNRRKLVLSGVIGGLSAAALLPAVSKPLQSRRLLRPPHALPEESFVRACIRCGTCMKACVTGGLQPAWTSAGIAGIWTPHLVPRLGYCEASCSLCGELCPTGAIRPFTAEQKPSMPLGKAKINRDTCIAWKEGKVCLICGEHCHYGAIESVENKGVLAPVLKLKHCVGCGFCENRCPVRPEAAITVHAIKNKE